MTHERARRERRETVRAPARELLERPAGEVLAELVERRAHGPAPVDAELDARSFLERL